MLLIHCLTRHFLNENMKLRQQSGIQKRKQTDVGPCSTDKRQSDLSWNEKWNKDMNIMPSWCGIPNDAVISSWSLATKLLTQEVSWGSEQLTCRYHMIWFSPAADCRLLISAAERRFVIRPKRLQSTHFHSRGKCLFTWYQVCHLDTTKTRGWRL